MSLQEGGEAGRRVTPDWAVRTKPLAFAADAAGYGVWIRLFGRSMRNVGARLPIGLVKSRYK